MNIIISKDEGKIKSILFSLDSISARTQTISSDDLQAIQNKINKALEIKDTLIEFRDEGTTGSFDNFVIFLDQLGLNYTNLETTIIISIK